MQDMMTVNEVVAYLKLAKSTVQQWCREGKLPAVKVGKQYRFRRADLDAWFEAQRTAA